MSPSEKKRSKKNHRISHVAFLRRNSKSRVSLSTRHYFILLIPALNFSGGTLCVNTSIVWNRNSNVELPGCTLRVGHNSHVAFLRCENTSCKSTLQQRLLQRSLPDDMSFSAYYKGRASPPKMRFLHLEIFLVSDITSFWPNPPLKISFTKMSYAQASRYSPLDNYHVSIFCEGEAVKPLRNFSELYSQNS